jgi:hypothetical protein
MELKLKKLRSTYLGELKQLSSLFNLIFPIHVSGLCVFRQNVQPEDMNNAFPAETRATTRRQKYGTKNY